MREAAVYAKRQQDYERLWALLQSNGGNGLFRFTPDGEGRTYQIVVLAFQVVGVTRDGEYQPRTVAEDLIRALVELKGDVEWVPFPGYYPPIHLLFYLPLHRSAGGFSSGASEEEGSAE